MLMRFIKIDGSEITINKYLFISLEEFDDDNTILRYGMDGHIYEVEVIEACREVNE